MDIKNIIIAKLLTLPGIIIGLSVHEFGHAFVAYKLGDDTQKYMGRLTLDPLKHMDPIGFLMLLFAGFGWAKPVQFNPRYFKNYRRDTSLVALAGVTMNLITAIFFTIVLGVVFYFTWESSSKLGVQIVYTIIDNIILINIGLLFFNLIPIPPLDGHHVLGNIVGGKLWDIYYRYADYFRIGLLIFVFSSASGYVIGPLVSKTYSLLINGLNAVLGLIM